MARTAEEGAGTVVDDGETPSLVVVCGFPGVGKSRVARVVADRLSASVYRTDEVRKELYDDPDYTPEETDHVYAEVLDRALAAVETDGRAVLDGTYRNASFREDVVAGADRLGVECAFVRVTCSESVVRERIRNRSDDPSDAGLDEYHLIREQFDPLSRSHVRVDNSGDWEQTRDQVDAAFPHAED